MRAAATLAMFLPRRLALDGLHGRPPHEFGALLGDVPAADNRVGLAVLGGQSGPRTQVAGIGEAVHVPDFGDEYRTEDRADAGQLLNRLIAAIAVKFGGDLLGEPPLVGVENVDQLQQRGHPLRVGGAERHPGQAPGGPPRRTGRTPRSTHRPWRARHAPGL